MKCQILFSRKNMKNILKYRLLKFLPRVLSVYEAMVTTAEFMKNVEYFTLQAFT